MDDYFNFTHDQAARKIGVRVRVVDSFGSVPEGTIGTVVDIDQLSGSNWGVWVEWHIRDPYRDAFTRDQYERFLEEI